MDKRDEMKARLAELCPGRWGWRGDKHGRGYWRMLISDSPSEYSLAEAHLSVDAVDGSWHWCICGNGPRPIIGGVADSIEDAAKRLFEYVSILDFALDEIGKTRRQLEDAKGG